MSDENQTSEGGGAQGPAVILDTNVFVAAGFSRRSASARILKEVRAGRLRMAWNEQTRRETRNTLRKIPPLSWDEVAGLFREDGRHDAATHPEKFGYIEDAEDRKFAALSAATGATLVTNDEELLRNRHRIGTAVLTPGAFWRRHYG